MPHIWFILLNLYAAFLYKSSKLLSVYSEIVSGGRRLQASIDLCPLLLHKAFQYYQYYRQVIMEENIREYQKAVRFLCDEIRNDNIKVGNRIPTERAIAQELNISRNSTREAIRSLENMGIIESCRGSGNYYTGNVSKHLSEMIRTLLSIKHISYSDINDFRRIMDKAVCMYIINRTDFDLSDAGEILERKPSSLEEEIKNDREFHFSLIKSSGNKLWIELMSAVGEVYEDLIRIILENSDPESRLRYHDIHKNILKALNSHNYKLCETYVNLHYDMIDSELNVLFN